MTPADPIPVADENNPHGLPYPAVRYADDSYRAYSRDQMIRYAADRVFADRARNAALVSEAVAEEKVTTTDEELRRAFEQAYAKAHCEKVRPAQARMLRQGDRYATLTMSGAWLGWKLAISHFRTQEGDQDAR